MGKPTDLQMVVSFFVGIFIWGYLAMSLLHWLEN